MASLNIDISHISPFNIDRSFQSPWERSPYISPKVLTFRTEKDKQNQGLMAHRQAGVGIDDLPPAITFTAPQMLGSNKQRIRVALISICFYKKVWIYWSVCDIMIASGG